jgi:hypothetical protein
VPAAQSSGSDRVRVNRGTDLNRAASSSRIRIAFDTPPCQVGSLLASKLPSDGFHGRVWISGVAYASFCCRQHHLVDQLPRTLSAHPIASVS